MTRGRRAAGAQDAKFGTLDASGAILGAGPLSRVTRKYKNVPTTLDGITFDSRREAERYGQLRVMQLAGAIRSLAVHERFPLVVRGEDCGAYEADFTYLDAEGRPHVEDVKSAATRKLPTFRLKAKLMFALYGIRVEEV